MPYKPFICVFVSQPSDQNLCKSCKSCNLHILQRLHKNTASLLRCKRLKNLAKKRQFLGCSVKLFSSWLYIN